MQNELLGQLIRDRRIELGYSHADLHNRFQIYKRSIVNLENGNLMTYRTVTIDKVANALNLDKKKIWELIEQ